MEDTKDPSDKSPAASGGRDASIAPGPRAALPLEAALAELVKIAEQQSSQQVIASILLLDADGKHLRHGAAPSLPAEYCKAIDGIEIGPSQGSCGTAAFYRRTVVVDDIQSNVLWANFKELASKHDLRACWSTPIFSSTVDQTVLGTFALYHRTVAVPSKHDIDLVLGLVSKAAQLLESRRGNA